MKIINLVGERFGLLTVEKRQGINSSKHTTWQCICECGNKSIHTSSNLKSGNAKSCGCLRKKPQRIDLSNQKFGFLTVKSLNNVENDKKIAYWNCICKCGNKKIVSTGHLKSGHTKSCGCLKSETSRNLAYKNLAGKKKISENKTLQKRIVGGYIKIHDRNHARSDKSGFVFEHIVVMENIIGRCLSKNENVHHKNGDRSDNRPENLELWDTSQPPGQRVKDKANHYISWICDLDHMSYIDKEKLKTLFVLMKREIERIANGNA